MPRTRLNPKAKPWTEASIGKALAAQLFMGRSILAIPCCGWTGHECDLLVVEKKQLRIIDVEIKISRADLKADLKKNKWWFYRPWSRTRDDGTLPRQRRQWPPKVWKHYYAMPAEIWKDELLAHMPENSGILLLQRNPNGYVWFTPLRHAKPDKTAVGISPADCIDLARLAGLRMWSAFVQRDELKGLK